MAGRWILGTSLLLVLGAPNARAQDAELAGRMHGVEPPVSYRGERALHSELFRPPRVGGWISRATDVNNRRTSLRGATVRGGPPRIPSSAVAAVSGDFRIPVLRILYANSDSVGLSAFAGSGAVARRFFSTSPAPPYSLTTFYREMSRGLLNVEGEVGPWVRVTGSDAGYEGGCNGLFCPAGQAGMAQLIREAVAVADANVDFARYDNDGPGGVPDSGDDDGVVDALVLFHPELDGAVRHGQYLGSSGDLRDACQEQCGIPPEA